MAPDGTTKYVLRKAFQDLVPEPILERRDKIGFSTPEAGWLAGESAWVTSILNSNRLTRLGIFNRENTVSAFSHPCLRESKNTNTGCGGL